MKNGLVLSFALISICLLQGADSFAAPTLKERMKAAASSPYEEERVKIRSEARQTLGQLYQMEPESVNAIKKAYGYAVFSNFGMKIFLTGGGRGHGVAVINKNGREVFMKMLEVQAGLGLGIKQYRQVWFFDTKEAFDEFVGVGWELGAQATAAAQVQDVGGAYQGAVSIAPGVWLYQLTGNGLALEITAKGTKYYQDEELNTK